MDVDQPVGGLAQLGQRGAAAVDPGAALALAVDRAAQQQAVAGVESGFVEPADHACGHVEFGADVGARGPFADHTGFAAAAQGELQCVDQNRLARAGFARQHRKAALELNLHRMHDDEIPQ